MLGSVAKVISVNKSDKNPCPPGPYTSEDKKKKKRQIKCAYVSAKT